MNHFNGLTPAQAERLALLAEECAEAIQAVTKIQRHGWDSYHPNGGLSNRDQLAEELGHVQVAAGFLLDRFEIDENVLDESAREKTENVKKYLHHHK